MKYPFPYGRMLSILALALFLFAGCNSPFNAAERQASSRALTEAGIMFDDFQYSSAQDPAFEQFGWYVSSYTGGVGPVGSKYWPEMISFASNPARSNDKVVRLSCSTDGTPSGTKKAEIGHQQQYANGTWAARVRFTNSPVSGPDTDEMIQTFFGYHSGAHHNEIDFEYLPNGGWGASGSAMLMSCYTPDVRNEPPYQTFPAMDASGWHTLVMVVETNTVRHYIDGVQKSSIARTSSEDMTLLFNHWITAEGLDTGNRNLRTWEQDVDWVYYAKGRNESTATIEAKVNQYRNDGTLRGDTVSQNVPVISVSLSTPQVSLAQGATNQFSATVSGTSNTAVTWTCTGGTITNGGWYTAGQTAGTYMVRATSQADSSAYASATVTITGQTGQSNIAPQGSPWVWIKNSSISSNSNRSARPAVNDGNTQVSSVLNSAGENGLVRWQSAGITWPTARTISKVIFVNGGDDGYGNGFFNSGLTLQYTLNGSTWTNASWTVSPSYPSSEAAWMNSYSFTGSSNLTGIRGIRVSGSTGGSWSGSVCEVQVLGQ